MATPDDFAFADAHGGSANAAAAPARAPPAAANAANAANAAPPPPPRRQPNAAIAIPSLEQVRAAEAREPQDDIFDPRAVMRAQREEQERRRERQEQQQQQHAPPPQPPVWPPPLLPHAPGPPALQGVLPAASVPRYGVDGVGGAEGAAPQPSSLPLLAPGPPQNAIVVSRRQQGNPVLRHLRHVRWRWGGAEGGGGASSSSSSSSSSSPDFTMGDSTAALFLSLRYHLLNPGYIGGRLRALQQQQRGGGGGAGGAPPAAAALAPRYRLVVLLLLVDAEDPARPLAELSQLALRADASLVCATSEAEAARYLEAFQAFERKATLGVGGGGGGGGAGGEGAGGGGGLGAGGGYTLGAGLRPPPEPDYLGRVASVLSAVRGVNRADALRLAESFGSVASMLRASGGELAAVRGIGPTKVRRLHEAFSQPFRRTLIVHRRVSGGVFGGGQAGAAAGAAAAATEATAATAAADAAGSPTSAAAAAPTPSQPSQPGLEMPIETEEEADDDDQEENDRLLQLADELGI